WKRSEDEVNFLLNLYRRVLHKKIDGFHKKNVRINIIGNLLMFPKDVQEMTLGWMEKTKNNNKITVNFALSYGGRDEIIRAIKKIGQSPKQWNNVTIEQFSNSLDTSGQPDPDLLIRTGGEKRLSGFLLWQLEYAELFFSDDFWPDFTPEKFRQAIEDFYYRQRRFGK
ncbi:di-trans,poly-cis-decaprenylcistransferase, partial [Candidatus Gottesmanbacteria bacterium]|nr:di-trans,poly-cis-decaprenylcistransferase [Candidatus Gottesmanbacteria bacterium]